MSDLTPAEKAAKEVLWPAIGNEFDLYEVEDLARAVVAAVTPIIAAETIGDHETEHIVQFEETTFSVQHPVSERLDGSLFDCTVHAELCAMGRPPVALGRYRAVRLGARSYRYEPVGPTLSRPTAEETR